MTLEQEADRLVLPLLLVSTTVARAPATVFSVLFVLHSRVQFDSFAPGGTAVLLYSVGAAVSGLTSASLLTWLGQWGTAAVTGAATVVALFVQSLPGSTEARFEGLALVVGLVMPPLNIASRVLYPQLLPPDRLLRVYSWDVTLTQVAWIVVPAGVVAVEPVLGVSGIYRLLTVMTVVGVGVYVLTVRRLPEGTTHLARPSSPRYPSGVILRDPRLYVYIGAGASMWFISGVVMPILIAVSTSSGAKSISILVWSVGSLLGSILVNRHGIRRSRLVGNLVFALAFSLLGLLWLHTPAVGLTLLVLGFSTAPVIGSLFYFIVQRYPAERQAFVFGLSTSVQLVFGGISALLAGLLLDHELYVALGVAFFVPIGILLVLVGGDAFASATPAPMPGYPREVRT